MRDLRNLLKKRSVVLGLVLLVAVLVLVGSMLSFRDSADEEVRSAFRDEVLAIAIPEWERGNYRVNITQVLAQRLDQNAGQNAGQSKIELFDDLGLAEVRVIRHQRDLLKKYDADTYRGFEAIIHRAGIATYWEVTVIVFYRNNQIVDFLAFADYESL